MTPDERQPESATRNGLQETHSDPVYGTHFQCRPTACIVVSRGRADNPTHRLFGQATSRARRKPPYNESQAPHLTQRGASQSPTFAFITYPFRPGRLLSCGYREYGGKGSTPPPLWAESPSGTCSDGSTLVALPCAARRRLTGLAIDCGTGGYPCARSDEQNPGACRKPTSTAVECRDE